MKLRRMARGLGGRSVRAAGLAVALACGLAGAAHAQSSALSQEVERLKADLKDLQRYVYGGGSTGGATVTSESGAVAVGGDARVAQFEVRITALEDQIRQLQGQIEEIGYNQRNLQERLDRLVADVDARLAALEGGGAVQAGLATGSEAAAATGDSGGATVLVPPDEDGGTATATGDQVLPPGSAMDQYNYAFSLLKKADYDDAEKALSAFVEAHPQDPLTGNALYWLGETYYVRADYNRSAVTFLRGYRDFPTGTKAADNLLKLGMSLAKLDKKVEACATFSELGKKFPDASEQIRTRAKTEAAALGCS